MAQDSQQQWAGILKMRLEKNSLGRSFAPYQYHEGALRVLRPHYLDNPSGQVTYTVINPGGAYFGADRYLFEIQTQPGAQLLLTTQSATKVYKTPQGPAFQQMDVDVHENSVFEYMPDQLIVYREGSYRQNTSVLMRPSSTVVLAEIITSGWSPDQQEFRYHEISTRTEIKVAAESGTRRLVVDQLRLKPQMGAGIKGMGMMEGYSHAGQLLLADARITDDLFDQIVALAEESDTYSGVSRAGTGEVFGVSCISVRSLAHTTAAIAKLQSDVVNLMRRELRQQSPLNLRKY